MNEPYNKNFFSLHPSECLRVYQEIVNNSNKKWEMGLDIAASTEDYGMATSLLLISIEESIKALIVLLDGHGFKFRQVPGMKAFFKNHEIRYVAAFGMFFVSVLGEDVLKHLRRLMNGEIDVETLREQLKANDPKLENKMKLWVFRKFLILRKEFALFSLFDKIRQDGFYCDYDNGIKSPLNIKYNDFKKIYTRLKKVRYMTRSMIIQLSPHKMKTETNQKWLTQSFQHLDNEQAYELLAKAFQIIKKSKKKPFDLLRHTLTDLLEK